MIRFVFTLMVLSLFSGCASQPQMQAALNDIDQHWAKINQKILLERGERVVIVPKGRAQGSVITVAKKLGFEYAGVLKNSPGNTAAFKAKTPTPFNEKEWDEIRMVEEPMMQAMAARHVGGFTSSFFVLSSGNATIWIAAYFSDITDNSTKIRLAFEIQWPKEKREQLGLTLGTQPPPEAVRGALDKFWDELEKEVSGFGA